MQNDKKRKHTLTFVNRQYMQLEIQWESKGQDIDKYMQQETFRMSDYRYAPFSYTGIRQGTEF